MRILTTLTLGIILLTAATMATAKDRAEPQPNASRSIQQAIFMQQAHVTLTRSPYYLEIQEVNDQVDETEKLLLSRLQTATDDAEVSRLIQNLERLEVDRELGVLKIQARYAHNAGMLDLEMKIRDRILNILEDHYNR